MKINLKSKIVNLSSIFYNFAYFPIPDFPLGEGVTLCKIWNLSVHTDTYVLTSCRLLRFIRPNVSPYGWTDALRL